MENERYWSDCLLTCYSKTFCQVPPFPSFYWWFLWRFPPFWPIDLRFPTNRSIGIGVGNLNLVREKELGFPSPKRVGFNLSLLQHRTKSPNQSLGPSTRCPVTQVTMPDRLQPSCSDMCTTAPRALTAAPENRPSATGN